MSGSVGHLYFPGLGQAVVLRQYPKDEQFPVIFDYH